MFLDWDETLTKGGQIYHKIHVKWTIRSGCPLGVIKLLATKIAFEVRKTTE